MGSRVVSLRAGQRVGSSGRRRWVACARRRGGVGWVGRAALFVRSGVAWRKGAGLGWREGRRGGREGGGGGQAGRAERAGERESAGRPNQRDGELARGTSERETAKEDRAAQGRAGWGGAPGTRLPPAAERQLLAPLPEAPQYGALRPIAVGHARAELGDVGRARLGCAGGCAGGWGAQLRLEDGRQGWGAQRCGTEWGTWAGRWHRAGAGRWHRRPPGALGASPCLGSKAPLASLAHMHACAPRSSPNSKLAKTKSPFLAPSRPHPAARLR